MIGAVPPCEELSRIVLAGIIHSGRRTGFQPVSAGNTGKMPVLPNGLMNKPSWRNGILADGKPAW